VVATTYTWRGTFTSAEVNALHAEAFDTRVYRDAEWNWLELVNRHSLGWVVGRDGAKAAGCEYLHVDFEDHLSSFYYDACGFVPTNAGLLALT